MITLHYPTAFKALDRFIDAYNEKAFRTIDMIRSGATLAAKEIIRIYGISLLKINGIQQVMENDLPSLQTNNLQLAKLVKCSGRTIQRYIAKLQTAGVIIGKKFRGSNANYELWINPSILLIKDRLSVEKTKNELKNALYREAKSAEKSGVSSSITTSCPHTYSCNTGNNKNNLLIEVDNPEKSYSTGNSSGNTGDLGSRAVFSGHRNVAPDPARDKSLNHYSSMLWLLARNLLYRETELTERQVAIAKKLIRRLYEPAKTENLQKVHEHYSGRIALVVKYIQKDPTHRFVPLPYIYFDTNNPSGFVGTKKWYKADLARRIEVERELVLGRTLRRFRNNDQKETSKQIPRLQLYRECENRIGKFKDPLLLKRFHAAVLEYESCSNIKYN